MRKRAGLSPEQAAEAAGFSKSKLHRIEGAEVKVTGDDAYTLATAYQADAKTVAELVEAARQSSKRGWWHVYPDSVLGNIAGLVELQDSSRQTRQFTNDVIPGLLQTEDYAAAIIGHSATGIDAETIRSTVALRQERQQRFFDSDAELWAIIDQSALERPNGGPMVMADQLDHLAEIATRPQVRVQILPTNITGHAAQALPFSLIILRDGVTYVYVEMLTGGAYVDSPQEVEAYTAAWNLLPVPALDFDRSIRMIREIAEQHRSTA
jgi:transcriptional regulator with XRE-family HTH domain